MKKKQSKTMLDEITADKKRDAWVIQIEEYCNQNGITPEDLIAFHKDASSVKTKVNTGSVKVQDFTVDKAVWKPYDPFKNPLFKTKMGGDK